MNLSRGLENSPDFLRPQHSLGAYPSEPQLVGRFPRAKEDWNLSTEGLCKVV